MTFRAIITGTGVLVALILATPAAAHQEGADDSGVFTIVAGYAPDADREAVQGFREDQGTLTAVVDGERCATIDIREEGDVSLVLGTASQPEVCGRAGAEVVLFNEHGNEMFERFTVEPGATAYLYNYAVAPVATSAPGPAAAGSGGMLEAAASPSVPGVMASLGVGLLAVAFLLRRKLA